MQPDASPKCEITPPQTSQTLSEACRFYSGQLLAFARRSLRKERIPEADYAPEDSVQSGFHMLLDAVVRGKLNSVEGVEGCLGLLRRAIAQKISAERRRLDAAKRGGTGVRRGRQPESEPEPSPRMVPVAADLNLFESGLPEPEVLFISYEVVKQFRSLLNPEQAEIVNMRLGGLSNAEIAQSLGTSRRTIERHFEDIRQLWSKSGLTEPE